MKLNHLVAGAVLAAGLGAAGLVGAGAAGAAPVGAGVGFAEKPHHDWKHPGKGPRHAKWAGNDGLRGVDACITATSPYGNVSGFVCI
ncbi:hypothetical protein [Mycolicibacterium vaccae]|uniref:Uncharacterized protein n=1 Tax=Mycolicibacterium vaccae ATCC 25954 TaxID=1194972 RepID=K0VKZ1_MYCVA|nr:hypothetical protein [Mycolicibacterium vaccae]ANI38470.1 hypothetical protein MYVA_1250 [Mycolicibacterium vaccae 95051]EJZ11779.1 hypothetical protein MVAC_04372 [Mycolicibacterium vaccae ATCC 25954]MCV7063551.1 hypothetical protein [Mycolicibacterium vaccae]